MNLHLLHSAAQKIMRRENYERKKKLKIMRKFY